jgi:hypothetical protein
MSRRGLETKSRKKLVTRLGGIDQAGLNHRQKAVKRDSLGHSSLREKRRTKYTLHVLAAKNVAGIGECRHPAAIDVDSVPADVVHMQMGNDDMRYVGRLDADCGKSIEIWCVHHMKPVAEAGIIALLPITDAGVDDDRPFAVSQNPAMEGRHQVLRNRVVH